MKVWIVLLNNNDYMGWTQFIGVYATFELARQGVYDHARQNDQWISCEYHPQLGEYRGENPDKTCFEVEDYSTYEYETFPTQLEAEPIEVQE